MSKLPIPQHVFVSYSSIDKEFVDQLISELERNDIEVWVDRKNLEPGTPDWDAAITDAIANAFALVLIATPNSKKSIPVYGELQIARKLDCPIVPVLVEGDFADAIRLDMAAAQYIDLTPQRYSEGLKELISFIKKLIDKRLPDHFLLKEETIDRSWSFGRILRTEYVAVEVVDKSYALIRHKMESPLRDLLDRIYTLYAKDYVRAYSYGVDWILVTGTIRGYQYGSQLVVADWDWLVNRNEPQHPHTERSGLGSKSLQNFTPIAEVLVSRFDVPMLSIVTDLSSKVIIGVAIPHSPRLERRYEKNVTKFLMYAAESFEKVSPSLVNPNEYFRTAVVLVEEDHHFRRNSQRLENNWAYITKDTPY